MVLLIGYSTASRRSRQRSESAGIGPIGDGIATIRNDGSDRTMDEDPDVKENQEDKDNERLRLVPLAKIYDITKKHSLIKCNNTRRSWLMFHEMKMKSYGSMVG